MSSCELDQEEDWFGACCTAQSACLGCAAGITCPDCMPARSRNMTSSCSRSSLQRRSSISLSAAICRSSKANILCCHSFDDPVENVAVSGGAVQLMLDLLLPHTSMKVSTSSFDQVAPQSATFLYLMPRMIWEQPL